MTAIALVNPHAGGGAAGRMLGSLREALAERIPGIEVICTKGPGHATAATRHAISLGCTRIVALGGDGTIGEVVNGMVDAWQPTPARAELSVIQIGTGGDLQRSIWGRVPLHDALARLISPDACAVDLGIAEYGQPGGRERRLFVNAASMGVSAQVAHEVNALPSLKRFAGAAAFAVGALRGVIRARPFRATLCRVGGQRKSVTLLAAALCNGRVFGGGMRIAPQALLGDGYLDLVLVHATARWRALAALPHLYRGTHLSLGFVEHARIRDVSVETEDALPLEFDGDTPACASRPHRFTVAPEVVRLRGWNGVTM